MPAERRGPEAGFTLVEVLVALVVSALLLAIVSNGAVSARERERAAAQKREAALVARDLAARSSVLPLAPGERSGAEGKLAWMVTESIAASDPRGRFVLAALRVRVAGPGGAALFDAETRVLKTVPLR
jgi:prepilin-type N-terminal cleavage/methylation domain-containing protein